MDHTLRLVDGRAPLLAMTTERVGVLCASAARAAIRYRQLGAVSRSGRAA